MLSAPARVGVRWIPTATGTAHHSVGNPAAAGVVTSALSRSLSARRIARAAPQRTRLSGPGPRRRGARTASIDRVTRAESLTVRLAHGIPGHDLLLRVTRRRRAIHHRRYGRGAPKTSPTWHRGAHARPCTHARSGRSPRRTARPCRWPPRCGARPCRGSTSGVAVSGSRVCCRLDAGAGSAPCLGTVCRLHLSWSATAHLATTWR